MCGIVDIGCKVNEAIAELNRGIGSQAWDFIGGAFTGRMGSLSATDYQAGADLAGKLIPVMAVATVLVAALQIMRGLGALDRAVILKAVATAALAPPLTLLGIWFSIRLTNGFDSFTHQVIGDSAESYRALFQGSIGGVHAAPPGLGMLQVMLIVWLLSLVLSVVMMLRNIAIIALIGLAPFALMTFGWDMTREWSKTWIQTLLALAIAKPATALLLNLGSMLASVDLPTSADAGYGAAASITMAITVLLLACLTPAAALSFVKFAGGSTAQQVDGAGSQLGNKMKSSAMTASRVVTKR